MRRVRKFLEWFLDDSIKEAVIGDLYELYDYESEQGRKFTAIRFVFRALGFVRKSLYRKTVRFTTLTEALIRSSLSMSNRRFIRRPIQAFGGFFGLILGVVCFASLVSYVVFSFSFDRHLSEDIHRIVMDVQMGEADRKVAVAPAALQSALISSGIQAARLRMIDHLSLIQGNITFPSIHAYQTGPEFIDLFDVKWKMKTHDLPLTEPNFVYVSESFYEKLEKSQLPITLVIGEEQNVMLGGVFYDLPNNTHLQPEILLPIQNEEPSWMDWNWITYAAEEALTLATAVEGHYNDHLMSRMTSMDASINFQFQPVQEIYFSEPRDFDSSLHTKKELIVGLAVVALLIGSLIVSNYVFQLLTRLQRRKKELYVRGIVGAYRSQQQWIFRLESGTELALSFCAAVLLLIFNSKYLWIQSLVGTNTLWLAAICLLLWFGSFIFIKSIQLVSLRLISSDLSVQNGWGRFFLLWLQFAISISLVAGMYAVSNQVQLLSNMDPGYQRDQIIDFTLSTNEASALEEAVNSLVAFSNVKGVAICEQTPGSKPPVNGFSFRTSEGVRQQVISQAWVNEQFFEVLEIPLISGEMLSPRREDAVVVNEQFLSLAGLGANELVNSPIQSGDEWSGTIVGIVKDFHFTAMDQVIEPMVYRYEGVGDHLLVRVNGNESELLPDLLFALNQINEFLISDYAFLDSKYELNYTAYRQQLELLKLATLLAFALTAMGLWSSVMSYAMKRQKTLSLHKIHGASNLKIWWMLFAPFLVIALTSTPVAIYAASTFCELWLSSFPYRIAWPIADWVVLIAGILLGLVLTLFIRSKKVWAANPAHILGTE